MRSIKDEVTNTPSVKSASRFFQIGNDLHRANFRRARNRARGKRCANRVEGVLALAQTRNDVRNDVHDVAVALDHHLFRHADAAKVRDPSKIISPETDQHYVLSALFGSANKSAAKLSTSAKSLPPW